MLSLNLPKVLIFVILCGLCGYVFCKQCSNKNNLGDHLVRYNILTSKDEAWKIEMLSKLHEDDHDYEYEDNHNHHHGHGHDHDHDHDHHGWSKLPPRKMLKQEQANRWAKLYESIKYNTNAGAEASKGFLKEVSLHDVRLLEDSLHWTAQQTNLEYLFMLDNDNLLWSFRKQAGLPTPGTPYGGWESPSTDLRGHFVGHYMSATARMWASTHNETLKQKMNSLVSELYVCQMKIGTGYLSAFPTVLFDRYETILPVWAPYYTVHKIMAGLFDQYTIAGNEEALRMLKWMVDYFYNRVQNAIKTYSIELHYKAMNEETGGMNDVLYNLYSVTGDPKHLLLAHLFDKPCFLGILATKANYIGELHANTHIPIVIGAQRRYEITGDPLYKEMTTFFLDLVNSSHTFATGGTTENEHWREPTRLASHLTENTEETCTTYNMLKVARTLFRWTKEISYADYYERALTNGILSIQRGRQPGRMIYFLPLNPGTCKNCTHSWGGQHAGWGTLYSTFWCCYGTAIESFSKLGDSIYFEEQGGVPGLYIIQYIESSINWKSGKLNLTQKLEQPVTAWDPVLRVSITIDSSEPSFGGSTLHLRIPTWANGDGAKASLNDRDLSLPHPGNYLTITRRWNVGDKIILELPLNLRTEQISDDRPEYASLQAVLYGPYLLAGLSFGPSEFTTEAGKSPTNWITPIAKDYNDNLITLSQVFQDTKFVLTKSSKSDPITMENLPDEGTDGAANSTFRIVPQGGDLALKSFDVKSAIGKLVQLEAYNQPGNVITHQDESLVIAPDDGEASLFHVRAGLDHETGTVSFESEDQRGCYIYSELKQAKNGGAIVKLACGASKSDENFKRAVSFNLEQGLSQYHPISFIAKGKNRSYLLSPLLSLRDESYTVYFNFTTSV